MDKKLQKSDSGNNGGVHHRSQSRREFLTTGVVIGAGTLPLVGTSTPDTSETESSRALPRFSSPAQVSAIGAEKEDWREPWEWRPSDWPGERLHLNLVPHASPTSVIGSDVQNDLENLLFSYNGVAPGPTIRMRGDETLFIKLRNHLGPNVAKQARPDKPDWCLPAHTNGPHQLHTTNLHTHGLHVSPERNRSGSWSDNVLLRIIPRDDYELRRDALDYDCWPLRPTELVAEADYEFRLGALGPIHPPGTHWYHPHPHGATFAQVASGMAGFLIVEGDVDEALREQIPDYRERLMLIQRVLGPKPADPNLGFLNEGQRRQRPLIATYVTNGSPEPRTFFMRPGAIERWRILNGSVDGLGYVELVLVEGVPPELPDIPKPVDPSADKSLKDSYRADARSFLSALGAHNEFLRLNSVPMRHLAMDGVTLVSAADGPSEPEMAEPSYVTRRIESLILAPANRADILFKAPHLSAGGENTLTLVARFYADASDQAAFQKQSGRPAPATNLTIAKIVIKGDPAPEVDLQAIDLPPVPKMLHPITDDELRIPQEEARRRGNPDDAGKWRTRQISYSGWGGGGKFPCPGLSPEPGTTDPKANLRTMMIDGTRFDPNIVGHRMALGTAEEWTIWNHSMTVWDDDPLKATGEKIVLRAVDHPLHIHVNPFWVVGIFDDAGRALDWDYESRLERGKTLTPRWQDTVRLPRNGGRVVFRSRFWDYPGEFVHHCHILGHEDNGMMQTVSVVTNPAQADYVANDPGYSWPALTREQMYTLNYGDIECPDHPECQTPHWGTTMCSGTS